MNEFAIVDLRHRNRGEGALVKDGSGWGLPNTVKNYNRLSGVVYIGNGTVLIKSRNRPLINPPANDLPPRNLHCNQPLPVERSLSSRPHRAVAALAQPAEQLGWVVGRGGE